MREKNVRLGNHAGKSQNELLERFLCVDTFEPWNEGVKLIHVCCAQLNTVYLTTCPLNGCMDAAVFFRLFFFILHRLRQVWAH